MSRELFNAVQEAMRDRAPKVQRPARVGSKFLLSGLLKCGVCGRPYRAQGSKSGQFACYICGTLFTEGAGACSARYLNAPRLEAFVVEKVLDSEVTPSFGMGMVYLRTASSPLTSMPSTKLRMSALHSGIVPSSRKSRKSATYSLISSVVGSSTLRCSSWRSASFSRSLQLLLAVPQRQDAGRQDLQRQLACLNGLVELLKPLPHVS